MKEIINNKNIEKIEKEGDPYLIKISLDRLKKRKENENKGTKY